MKKAINSLYYQVKADFLERIRKYSFLFTMFATIYLSYIFVPELDAGYTCLNISNYRGIYNSAWIGTMVAMLCSIFLSLIGFYLVKNSIKREEKNNVGHIIASSPISNFQYIMGKVLSNFLLLLVIVFVIIIVSGVMQFVRGEVISFNLIQLILPFVYITIPTLFLTAVLAVFFESRPFLKGSLGNVIYFFTWIIVLSFSIIGIMEKQQFFFDIFGIGLPLNKILIAMKTKGIISDITRVSVSFILSGSAISQNTFNWSGVDWKLIYFIPRFFWIGVGIFISYVTARNFKRFDISWKFGKINNSEEKMNIKNSNDINLEEDQLKTISYSSLTSVLRGRNFVHLIISEIKLLFKGLKIWWYIVFGALFMASVFLKFEVAYQQILPILWLWPLSIFSSMGVMEKKYHTEELIYTANKILKYQFLAHFTAGVIITSLTASPVIIRLILNGDWLDVGALLIGAIFIPALALVAGVWSNGSRLFEVIYLLIWYIGPIQGMIIFDYMGIFPQTISQKIPLYYLLLSLFFVLLAFIRRRMQCFGK